MIDRYKYAQYKRALQTVIEYHNEMKKILNEGEDLLKKASKFSYATKEMAIIDVDISVRLFNILIGTCPLFEEKRGDTKVSVLEKLSIKEFLTYRGAGKASLKELIELCYCTGISMLP